MDNRSVSQSSSFGSSKQQQQQRLNNQYGSEVDGNGRHGQMQAADHDTSSSNTFSIQTEYSLVSIGFVPSFPYQMNAAQEAKAAAEAAAAASAARASDAAIPAASTSGKLKASPGRALCSDGSPQRTTSVPKGRMSTPKRLFGGLKKVEEEEKYSKFVEPVFFYNPTSRPRPRSCCQEHGGCMCMCVLLLASILALTCLILFLTLRPHPPAYELREAIVSELSLHPQDNSSADFLGADLPVEELGEPKRLRFGMDRLALAVRNRNSFARFAYRTAQLEARYEDRPLRALEVQGFSQKARGERVVEFVLPVEEVLVDGPAARNITLDFERGLVTVQLHAAIGVSVTVLGFFPLPSYRAPFSCFINVRLQLSTDVVTV